MATPPPKNTVPSGEDWARLVLDLLDAKLISREDAIRILGKMRQ